MWSAPYIRPRSLLMPMKSTMKTCIATVMSAVAVFCLAMDAAACTAVLVGKDASTTEMLQAASSASPCPNQLSAEL